MRRPSPRTWNRAAAVEQKECAGGCAERILAGDLRAAARAISALETDQAFARELSSALWRSAQRKPRLGITGSPGVGKSTLANALIALLRGQGMRVGVVAVDPSSPFSGGAVLGDRVRMAVALDDPNVYIRSVGSRGSLGGLSSATSGIVQVLEAFGVDIVLIETVGMGQTGFDIADISDTVALVLSPESGDGVQAMKAGVMEIADIYAVNKADRPGADALAAEVNALLSCVGKPGEWQRPVLKLCAKQGDGAEELLAAFNAHRAFLAEYGLPEERRRHQIANEIKFIVEGRVKSLLERSPQHGELFALTCRVLAGELDANEAADILLEGMAGQI